MQHSHRVRWKTASGEIFMVTPVHDKHSHQNVDCVLLFKGQSWPCGGNKRIPDIWVSLLWVMDFDWCKLAFQILSSVYWKIRYALLQKKKKKWTEAEGLTVCNPIALVRVGTVSANHGCTLRFKVPSFSFNRFVVAMLRLRPCSV